MVAYLVNTEQYTLLTAYFIYMYVYRHYMFQTVHWDHILAIMSGPKTPNQCLTSHAIVSKWE